MKKIVLDLNKVICDTIYCGEGLLLRNPIALQKWENYMKDNGLVYYKGRKFVSVLRPGMAELLNELKYTCELVIQTKLSPYFVEEVLTNLGIIDCFSIFVSTIDPFMEMLEADEEEIFELSKVWKKDQLNSKALQSIMIHHNGHQVAAYEYIYDSKNFFEYDKEAILVDDQMVTQCICKDIIPQMQLAYPVAHVKVETFTVPDIETFLATTSEERLAFEAGLNTNYMDQIKQSL